MTLGKKYKPPSEAQTCCTVVMLYWEKISYHYLKFNSSLETEMLTFLLSKKKKKKSREKKENLLVKRRLWGLDFMAGCRELKIKDNNDSSVLIDCLRSKTVDTSSHHPELPPEVTAMMTLCCLRQIYWGKFDIAIKGFLCEYAHWKFKDEQPLLSAENKFGWFFILFYIWKRNYNTIFIMFSKWFFLQQFIIKRG